MDTARIYYDGDNDEPRSIYYMVKHEPHWAANRIQEGEKFIKLYEKLQAENKRLKAKIYEAIGWTHSECCILLDKGKDPRQIEISEMIERLEKGLALTKGKEE